MLKPLKDFINYIRLNVQSFFRKVRIHNSTPRKHIEHLLPKIHIEKKWYGSSYGGFYVSPSFLQTDPIVYSFGIGKDITFDRKMLRNHKATVYGFDPTPKSITYIKSQKLPNQFHFIPIGIGTETQNTVFYLPKNKHGVSGSTELNETLAKEFAIDVHLKSFSDIIAELGHIYIDVLKIDIEGSEYNVIPNILHTGVPIGQILLEFHDRLYDEIPYRSKQTIQVLLEHGFEVFGTSLSYEEISLINREHIRKFANKKGEL
jgi:FkbM family methyltransferase